MADVAAAAGVSITTVSHVLNNTRPVSVQLRQRVHDAVAASGYSPNIVARSLATQNTMLIGVVMSFLADPFFGPLVAAIENTARRRGYTLLVTDNQEDVGQELAQVKIMLDRRVDGLILAPVSAARSAPVLDLLTQRHTPTVLIGRFTDQRFDEIGVENVHGTAALVRHLAGAGHTRIGLISGRAGLPATDERLAGYRLGLEQAGLPYARSLVRAGGSRIEPARAAVKALLDQPDPPTALIPANNAMTIGALRGLRDLGRRVPEDVAVVAFDDVAFGDLMDPSLTALAQPVPEMGDLAAKLLIKRVAGHDGPPQKHALPGDFRHRRSCGCHADPAR